MLKLAIVAALVGQFYQGDGTGTNWYLDLKSDSTYSFRWRGCLGEYGASEGRWSVSGRELSLTPRTTKDMADRLPVKYLVVRWGERTYLVPSAEIVSFCIEVNQASEPRTGAYGLLFLKDGDWSRKTFGKPDLPDEFLAFLLSKPVRAEIVAVKENRATINAGRNTGLRVGMELTAQDNTVRQVRVVQVDGTTAIVEPKYSSDDPLTPHTRLSTLLFDREHYLETTKPRRNPVTTRSRNPPRYSTILPRTCRASDRRGSR